jgi:hypothetical protein
MKSINKINIDQICNIVICIDKVCDDYTYKNYKKRWLLKDIKEGFYFNDWLDDMYWVSNESILKDKKLLIKDKIVYYKPYITVYLNDNSSYDKYFETEKELNNFLTSSRIKHLTFINQ